MPKFYNRDVEELAKQLAISPRRLRVEQLHGVERLLGLIEQDHAYPYELVCYHITGYRKRGTTQTSHSIPGKALIGDLVSLGETITRSSGLMVTDLGETSYTQEEVAQKLEISTKTVRRWRSQGLMGIRAVYHDGVNRLAFLERTLERFVKQQSALIHKGAAFSQLTEVEREGMVQRARQLVAHQPLKLHTVARILAEETGRAVETIRYTLRRFDAAHQDQAVFASHGYLGGCQLYEAMWHCCEAGDTPETIASAFECSVEDTHEALRVVQVELWRKLRWESYHCELFDAPNADALILDAPEPVGDDTRPVRVPTDLPAYLQSLYRTPLFTTEQEHDIFRRYNYLKFKIAKQLAELSTEKVSAEPFEQLRLLIETADGVKQRIIQANLRLVVSIAKKHTTFNGQFFEVISDGNMSLVRAVERFDFMRGVKFSTYATWAIVKNYARSIPEQRYQNARYITGQDEMLEAAPDRSEAAPIQSDKVKVRSMLDEAMTELSEREREIIIGHFGLVEGHEKMTLEQLGNRFGVTKERVRQIERKALGRLKEVLAPSIVDTLSG